MPIRYMISGLVPYIVVLILFLFLTVFSDVYTIKDLYVIDREAKSLCVQGICSYDVDVQSGENITSISSEALVDISPSFNDVTSAAGIDFRHHPSESDFLQIGALRFSTLITMDYRTSTWLTRSVLMQCTGMRVRAHSLT